MPGTKQVLNKYFLLGSLEFEIDLHRNLLEFSVAPIIGDPQYTFEPSNFNLKGELNLNDIY